MLVDKVTYSNTGSFKVGFFVAVAFLFVCLICFGGFFKQKEHMAQGNKLHQALALQVLFDNRICSLLVLVFSRDLLRNIEYPQPYPLKLRSWAYRR